MLLARIIAYTLAGSAIALAGWPGIAALISACLCWYAWRWAAHGEPPSSIIR